MVPRLHYSFPLTSSKHPIFAVCTPIYCLELLIMNLRWKLGSIDLVVPQTLANTSVFNHKGLKSPCYHQLVGQMR